MDYFTNIISLTAVSVSGSSPVPDDGFRYCMEHGKPTTATCGVVSLVTHPSWTVCLSRS